MAGGQGTRLRPLTSDQPKPMIPIVNAPCMEHIVKLLERHGFTDIAVTLQFMPDEIRDYFGDGSEWNVNMRYSVEDAPAGTAGSVKMAEQQLGLEGERLLIISGDALTDADLSTPGRVPRGERLRGHHGPQERREPPGFRHRHNRGGRAHLAFSGEAGLGAGLLRHRKHRHLSARALGDRPRSPTPKTESTTSPRSSSPNSSRPGVHSTATSPRTTGRTSAPWSSSPAPSATCSTAA